MQLERELKFRLDAAAAARALRAIPFAAPPQRRLLLSVYYDTPDLRLRRAGAALRLRRAGRDWLQALKAQQGAHGALAERAEWEIPAPRGRLACEAFPREAVRAATGLDLARLAPRLRPVFVTRFERRSAPLALGRRVKAVACIDRGALEAGRAREAILELELELQQGAIAPLLALAEALVEPLGLRIETASKAERGYRLAAGAGAAPPAKWSPPPIVPAAAARDACGALLGAALAQVGANAAGLGQASDPEYVHQLRVGVRRLRSALRVFRRLLKRRRVKAIERPLKRMMRTFGAARDWDVFCDTLAGVRAGSRLRALARRRRAAARASACRLARSAPFQLAQLGVLRWLHGTPWKSGAARDEPLSRFARRSLERLHAALFKRARGIDWRDAPRRHAVRIAVKHLRYGCDFFATGFPHRTVRPFLARLMSLQDTLGELNDVAVARDLLEVLAPPAAPAALRREAAGMRRALARRERRLIAALGPSWLAFAKSRPFWRAGK